jgi:FKBP-type peptidyl-prolyl cis-trans isomerase FklB
MRILALALLYIGCMFAVGHSTTHAQATKSFEVDILRSGPRVDFSDFPDFAAIHVTSDIPRLRLKSEMGTISFLTLSNREYLLFVTPTQQRVVIEANGFLPQSVDLQRMNPRQVTWLSVRTRGQNVDLAISGTSRLPMRTSDDSISYAIGVNIGTSFKDQNLSVNMEMFTAGVKDAMSSDPRAVRLTENQLQRIFAKLQQDMYEMNMEQMEEMSHQNLVEGEEFLRQNARKPGVRSTPSGFQYRVIAEGYGRQPTDGAEVTVHYRGRLLDGTVFDSSYERGEPATFQVDAVIDGWIEGLKLMRAGAKYEFYIPSSLGYGEPGNQVIPPNAVLIFEVELLSVKN